MSVIVATTLVAVAAALVACRAFIRARRAGNAPRPWSAWLAPVALGVATGGVAASVLRAAGSPDGLVALVGVAGSGVATARYAAGFAAVVREQGGHVKPRVTLTEADTTIASCRAELAKPSTTGASRVELQLLLAQALATSAARADGAAADLIEATSLLQGIVDDPAAGPVVRMGAAEELVNAMKLRRVGLGDVRGWLPALDTLERTARSYPDRGYGDGMALLAQAAREVYLAQSAATPDVAMHRHRAVELARVAEQSVPADLPLLADLKAMVANSLAGPDASANEVDQAIDVARDAHEVARRHWIAARGRNNEVDFRDAWLDQGVILATFLLERARNALDDRRKGLDAAVPTAGDDAAEAAALCWRAATRLPQANGDDTFWLAIALSLHERAGAGRWAGVADVVRRPPGVAEAFRRAFDDQDANLGLGVGLIAREWFAWAVEADRSSEAAEALWRLVTTVAEEWRRRLTRQGREQVLSEVQGYAAEAGWWLAEVGRTADAVVAVEYGRAALFTGPAGYVDADLENRLASAGHREAWDEWVAAATAVDQIFRSQYDDGADDGPAGPIAPEERVWARYQRASRQVDAAIGSGWDGSPAGYEAFRRNVADDLAGDTVVYVGAAERGGYALVLEGLAGKPGIDGAAWHPPPSLVRLPDLTAAAVEGRVVACEEARTSGERWPDVLDDLLGWLSEAFAAPLAKVVEPGSEIVLVSLGSLGFLPLHAAAIAPGSAPAYVVRYAPNARLAAAARRMAHQLADEPPSLMATAVPPDHDLPLAPIEVKLVRALYPSQGSGDDVLTRAEVEAALPDAGTWHFACHGDSRLDDPLESGLQLADGRLTVRDLLLRRAGRHRLAVLSACETDVPDLDLVDEAYTLPGGLLRAGVAGVVATQWEVGDEEAAVLSLEVHRRVLAGRPPGPALYEAQAWLRTATRRELHRASPELVPRPSEACADEMPHRRPVAWAPFCFTGA